MLLGTVMHVFLQQLFNTHVQFDNSTVG